MTEDGVATTIRMAIGGDAVASAWLVEHADGSDDARIVTMAAVIERRPSSLARARSIATTVRNRQVVAIARAHLADDHDLVDALARDHLVDHPDSLIVAWIASGGASRAMPDEAGSP